jgi:hypothetical protein
MKRLALVILARTLTDTDVRRLRDLFSAMDVDHDGEPARPYAAPIYHVTQGCRSASQLVQCHAGLGARLGSGAGPKPPPAPLPSLNPPATALQGASTRQTCTPRWTR